MRAIFRSSAWAAVASRAAVRDETIALRICDVFTSLPPSYRRLLPTTDSVQARGGSRRFRRRLVMADTFFVATSGLVLLRLKSAPIAAAACVGLAVFLHRSTCEAHARFACKRRRGLELLQEDRAREVVALRIADLGRGLQIGELLEGFDALRDHGHAKRLAQGFDRAQDALAARPLMDVGDEGTVDLDLVRRDICKRRQRRIADAEIVDRNADADRAQQRHDL